VRLVRRTPIMVHLGASDGDSAPATADTVLSPGAAPLVGGPTFHRLGCPRDTPPHNCAFRAILRSRPGCLVCTSPALSEIGYLFQWCTEEVIEREAYRLRDYVLNWVIHCADAPMPVDTPLRCLSTPRCTTASGDGGCTARNLIAKLSDPQAPLGE